MKLSKFATELENKGFTINFIATPEEYNEIDGQFDQQDDVDLVKEQLDNGNDAAWFCAKVSLEFEGLESEADYLGGCSYSSFDEFTGTDNDYFDDMLKSCLDDIQAKAEKIIATFPKLAA